MARKASSKPDSGNSQSSVTIGFEATAMRNSADLQRETKIAGRAAKPRRERKNGQLLHPQLQHVLQPVRRKRHSPVGQYATTVSAAGRVYDQRALV